MTAPVDQAVEAAAKLIYETWKDIPEYRLWQNGGNSLKQDEARRIARQVIELASQQEVAAPVGDVPTGLIACLRGGRQCDEDGSEIIMSRQACCEAADILESISASRVPVASPADSAYREAVDLATSLFKKHYAHEDHYASGKVVWGPCDTTAGVISQIDNMVTGLSRTPPVGAGGAVVMDARPDSVHSDSGECDWVQGSGPTDGERTLRRLLCLIYSRGHAYTDDGELSDSRQHPSIDFLRDAPADIEAKMTRRNADALTMPTQTVLLEHSGCGSNTQVDSLSVRLNPGDKVVLLKGRMTQEFDRADAAILAKGGDQGEGK